MNLQFESWQAFFSMGGHGPYIWASYLIVFAAMLFFGFKPNWQFKQFVKRHKRLAAQQQQMSRAKSPDESQSEVRGK